jgi:predicted acylesterase/phospholipase RssA
MSSTIENVLILQGGGSLGAFACGVFKALARSNIKIDIIADTSIGGVNASIIALYCSVQNRSRLPLYRSSMLSTAATYRYLRRGKSGMP